MLFRDRSPGFKDSSHRAGREGTGVGARWGGEVNRAQRPLESRPGVSAERKACGWGLDWGLFGHCLVENGDFSGNHLSHCCAEDMRLKASVEGGTTLGPKPTAFCQWCVHGRAFWHPQRTPATPTSDAPLWELRPSEPCPAALLPLPSAPQVP